MSESTWTSTPQTETFQTLQKLVAGYVLMPTDPEVLETAAAGIRRAIDRLNTRSWAWAITYDDITFDVDQTEYRLASGFKSPRNFEIWDANSQSVGRLSYKDWKTFLVEHQDITSESEPCVYSVSNVNAMGSLSLNAIPSVAWVAKYPTGRIWYYRKMQYPNPSGPTLDVPSEVVPFVQASAEAFTADRYAVAKAAPAYTRAERYLHELVVDNCHGGSTDWE